jgi:hypothetical protein
LGFGTGCLAYTVETNRSLKATPGLAGLIPLSSVDQAMRNLSPTLSSEKNGEMPAKLEQMVGKGRVVLYLNPADPKLVDASGKRYVEEMIPELQTQAERSGVHWWCRADDQYQVNLLYCGKNRISGRHLFTADFTQSIRNGMPVYYSDRSFQFTFDPSLVGDAEIIGFTDSFQRCEGGSATFSAKSHILTIRFRLPGKLTLVFGKNSA